MTIKLLKVGLVASAAFLFAVTANAGGVTLTEGQMDMVAAGGVESVDGFVCPVIHTDAVLNAKNGIMINGAYSILGPDVSVPLHATNNDGAGNPGDSFASPGDANYTPIWNTSG
jgi:hypothetical protein